MRLTLGIMLLVTGCTRAAPTSVSVKLAKLTTWPLSAEEADTLSDEQRAALAQRGIVFQGTTIVFPELPLVGYWVEVEGQRFMTDDNAVVALSAPADAIGSVYEDNGSTTVLTTFKIRDVAAQPSPARVEVQQVLPSPVAMNPDQMSKMARAASSSLHQQSLPIPYPDGACIERDITGCAPRANTMGCCVDYDNPAGNGKAYFRAAAPECSLFAVANFVQSTCFNWTAVSVCADEKAFGRGPPCWEHHKYRNCQNLSLTDFRAAPAPGQSLLGPGQTVVLTIKNNLPSNDTVIGLTSTLEDKGTLSKPSGRAALKRSGELYVINHYDDITMKHVEDVEVTYTAPPRASLPPFCTYVDVRVDVIARTFEALGGAVGAVVPTFPILRHETFVLSIDCGGDKPPELHLQWREMENLPHPNIDVAAFDTTSEIDLSPTKLDSATVTYEPTGGSVTFSYIPYDKSANDPCSYTASVSPVTLPPPPPAALRIAARSPGVIFSAGGVQATIITMRECPDPNGGPSVTDVQTFTKDFQIMNVYGPGATGSLEDLANGPLHGTIGGAGSGGPTVEWTLSRR